MALDCPALSFVCWQTTNRNVKCQQVQLGDQLLLGNVWKLLGWVFALEGLQHWYMTSWFATMCPLQLFFFWKFKDLSNHFLLLVLDQSDLLICDKVPPPTFWTILRIICFLFLPICLIIFFYPRDLLICDDVPPPTFFGQFKDFVKIMCFIKATSWYVTKCPEASQRPAPPGRVQSSSSFLRTWYYPLYVFFSQSTTTTPTTTTRKGKDLRTMSCAKVTRGAQRRQRRRRKTQRRPFIFLPFDFHFHYFDLVWFLTAHFETVASVQHHLSRVYPTSISNFPISSAS